MWTKAVTVDVCSECGDDIWPGEVILVTHYRLVRFPLPPDFLKTIFCKDCGELYQESMELGNDDETRK